MKKFLLVAILLFGFFIRTYHVSVNPPSLSWDEVSIGYNAYSILKTGKDEHGRFMPMDFFAAYGDYKPPLSVYSAVPFIWLFGLTDFAVRMPSAFFGAASLLLVYFLVIELFGAVQMRKNTTQFDTDKSTTLALITSAIFAISPWHINISRGGFEANVALFFVLLGTWFILSARTKIGRYPYIWLPFVAAIYTFNSARYFVPLLGIALFVFTYKEIRINYKRFFIGIVIALFTLSPIIPHLLSKEARLRFAEVNIFTDRTVIEQANRQTARQGSSFFSTIVNNRRIGFARSYLMHFTDNLQPNFLFIRGDGNPKFSIQDVGQLYIIEAPLLAIGFFALFSLFPSRGMLLLFWLLAAIIPAATARETPHALRILNSLPTWYVFIAFGIYSLSDWSKRMFGKKRSILFSLSAMFILVYILQVGYYLHEYYAHYPREFSGEWQYGYREALKKMQMIQRSYNRVVLTDSIGRPYMYTAFYTKAEPSTFLQTKNSYFDAAGFYHVDGFSTYIFLDDLPLSLDPDTLYIWDAAEIPKGVRIIDTIALVNGDPKLVIFDTGSVRL